MLVEKLRPRSLVWRQPGGDWTPLNRNVAVFQPGTDTLNRKIPRMQVYVTLGHWYESDWMWWGCLVRWKTSRHENRYLHRPRRRWNAHFRDSGRTTKCQRELFCTLAANTAQHFARFEEKLKKLKKKKKWTGLFVSCRHIGSLARKWNVWLSLKITIWCSN